MIFLKVNEENFMKRKFNAVEVEKEYKRIIEERKAQRQKEREEAKKKAKEEGGEDQPPEENPDNQDQQQPVEEEDPEAPNLEEMKNQKKEKLQQQRESDNAKVDELTEALNALGTQTVVIDADRSSEKVLEKILFLLRNNLEMRENMLEKH